MTMMKVVKGRQLLVMGLVALVLVAGYVRWTTDQKVGDTVPVMNPNSGVSDVIEGEKSSGISTAEGTKTEGTKAVSSSGNDYFIEAKQSKESARSESIEVLNAVISNQNSSAEAKSNAQAKIAGVAANIEKEAIIESLIKAKGYDDSVVFIDDGNVSVVVKSDGLEASGVAQIKDIVISQTGIRAEKIKISSI